MDIKINYIKAMQNMASNEYSRYFLKGVFIKENPDDYELVATDAYGLVRINVEKHGKDLGFMKEVRYKDGVILDFRNALKELKITKKDIYCELSYKDFNFYLKYAGKEIKIEVIDGKYPDYKRIEAKETEKSNIEYGNLGLNFNLLNKISKSFKLLFKEDKFFRINFADGQTNPFCIRYDGTIDEDIKDYNITVMPVRI